MTYEEAKSLLDEYIKATDNDAENKSVIITDADRIAALYVPLALFLSWNGQEAYKLIKEKIEKNK